jgi:hypothetical protein
MPSRSTDARIVAALVACGLSLASAGCDHKTVQAAAPVAAAPAPSVAETIRPMTIAPDTNATPPTETIAPPAVNPDPVTPPPAVVVPRPKPVKPSKPANEPAAEPATEGAHPPAPQISPQLTPQEQASYQRKMNEDIGVAERNLQQAAGKTHSAAQDDLREKIRRFIEQSREAGKTGDLVRAQTLAQKARLLSVELVESL